MKKALFLFVICHLFWMCQDEPKTRKGKSNVVVSSDLIISSISSTNSVAFGESFTVKIYTKSGKAGKITDINLNGTPLNVDSVLPAQITLPPASKLGKNLISVNANVEGQSASNKLRYLVTSDIDPVNSTYKVVNTFPHDQNAYTQGLVIYNGTWYEGTGGQGVSDIRITEKQNGRVRLKNELEDRFFGEGISYHNNKIYQLTWKSQTGFIYEPNELIRENTFFYEGEGWGITSDTLNLIISDGSNVLKFLDSKTWKVVKQLEVCDNRGPVSSLNELEYIDGRIWANVWQSEYIVIIDPETGKVEKRVRLKGLLKRSGFPKAEVLNGIAWDASARQLFVTGKYWPFIYQIEVVAENS